MFGSWLFRPMANIELPSPRPNAISGNSCACWATGSSTSNSSNPARSTSKATRGERPMKRR
ncbi:hypothetical protein D3C78_1080330 [compost metagenome]